MVCRLTPSSAPAAGVQTRLLCPGSNPGVWNPCAECFPLRFHQTKHCCSQQRVGIPSLAKAIGLLIKFSPQLNCLFLGGSQVSELHASHEAACPAPPPAPCLSTSPSALIPTLRKKKEIIRCLPPAPPQTGQMPFKVKWLWGHLLFGTIS